MNDYRPPEYQYPQYQTGPMQPGPDGTDRTVAILTHLAPIIAMVFSAGTLPFLGPLIVWFIYRHKDHFVRQAAAGSFNFNLSMAVVYIVGLVLILTLVLAPLGIPMMIGAGIASVVCSILGAVRASNGQPYRYPLQLPILS